MEIVSFFCKIALFTACSSQAYFIVQIPSLSLTDTICLQFHFSVSSPGVEGIYSPSISFCLYVVALRVHRASNVWLPCAPVALCRSISNSDHQLCMKLEWRDPKSRELNLIPLIYINIIHCLCPYTLRGYYCECVPAPSLLKQYPRYVPHRDCPGHNTVTTVQLSIGQNCPKSVGQGVQRFSKILGATFQF
jgi:hypothetical protein